MNRLHNKVVKGAGKKQKPVPVKIVSDYPAVSSPDETNKWRAQDDLRALQRAAEIQGDRSRLAAARKEAQAQIKVLSCIGKKR